MSFPWTLQRYIFTEMGKTFLLAATALTAVLGLGGGVFQMIKLGDVTPGQLVRLMGLVLPVAAALTLPIAVLFSAAATYGRLSADNEFVACRSSGINMHVLFLPTIVLGLASAFATFVLINFVIPGMVRNLNEFIGADLGVLVQQRLSRPRGLTLGGQYRIRADLSEVDVSQPNRAVLHRVAFAELENGEWVRYGTAREVHLSFDRGANRAWGRLVGLSYYDRKQDDFVDSEEVLIPANDLPAAVPAKLRFLNLGDLLHYRRNPGQWRGVREQMRRLRMDVGRWNAYADVWNDYLDGFAFTLSDEDGVYLVRSESGIPPHEGGIELEGVTVEESRRGRHHAMSAERALVEFARADALAEAGLRIELRNVTLSGGNTIVRQKKKILGPVAIDPAIVARIAAIPDERLLYAAPSSEETDPLATRREKAIAAWSETTRRVVATLHERLAFSVSVLVLVLLGSALGIVFRGAHVLTAFGISFVPSLVVIIAIVMGKQMAHNAPTQALGLAVMWSGIAVVAALDYWMLTRVLRR